MAVRRNDTGSSAKATRIIARIAARQHGLVSRQQALEAGVRRGLIAGRVESGWLVPIFPGIYTSGIGMLEYHGRLMAADLAAGPAVLSHYSAAALHGFIDRRASAIEDIRLTGGPRQMVSLPSTGARRFFVRGHRTRRLPDRDVTEVEGIPVTSVARTFLDIARTMSLDHLKTGLTETEKLGIFDLNDLYEVTGRGRGWTGTPKLRLALAEWDPLEVETRSKLEIAMLRLCRREDIPVPVVNTVLGDYRPDFLWRDHRLIVEVDGYGSHSGVQAFRGDRRRDVDLLLDDYRVARFTHEEVVRGSTETASRVRRLLELSRPR